MILSPAPPSPAGPDFLRGGIKPTTLLPVAGFAHQFGPHHRFDAPEFGRPFDFRLLLGPLARGTAQGGRRGLPSMPGPLRSLRSRVGHDG